MTNLAERLSMQLNEKQQLGLDRAVEWWRGEQRYLRPYVLRGYAGTGKSTLVEYILNSLDLPGEPALVAPTGKAALVLQERSGRPASTIHSFMYRLLQDEINILQDTLGELHSREQELPEDDPECETIQKRIKETEERIREIGSKNELEFIMRDFSTEASPPPLIIGDEWSMVGKDVHEDVISLGLPTLLVGDPFQLPPVKAKPGWEDLEADVELTKIERTTGEGAGINLAAEAIRVGRKPESGPGFVHHRRGTLDWDYYASADMVLVGTNALRRKMNAGIRLHVYGHTQPEPQPGERIICLQNSRTYGLRNGEVVTFLDVEGQRGRIYQIRIRNEMEQEKVVPCWWPLFADDSDRDIVPRGVCLFTFASAITTHKSQGSQWSHVIVCNSWPGRDKAQWLYTGVTRAMRHCDLVG